MTFRKKIGLPLAACMVLGLMVVAQSATATHPRPKGASPLFATMAVAYESCPTELVQAPNSTHAAPLSVPSCGDSLNDNNPASPGGGGGPEGPEQSSHYLTVGEPTLTPPHAAVANMQGLVRLLVVPGNVLLDAAITDVRCRSLRHSEQVPPDPPTPPVTLPCAAPASAGDNTTAGEDYLGELQASAQIRITDHNNSPNSPTSGSATVADIPFPVTGTCSATPVGVVTPIPPFDAGGSVPNFGVQPVGQNVGSTCIVNTDANAVCGCVVAGVRGNVELTSPLVINDGGNDGIVATTGDDSGTFLRNGIFIP